MGEQKEAVRTQLDAWGPKVAGTALAELALGLAGRLDDEDCPATAYGQIAGRLHAVLLDLEKAAPKAVAGDLVDEVRAQRQKRRGAS